MLCGILTASPATLEAAIVFSDDFETGATNLNSPGTPIDGQWITSPNLPGWTLGGSTDVSGTDAYSSPDGVYKTPHSGHITAAFFSAGNSGAINTASMERPISTSTDSGITYNIHFWISNPLVDTNARQNLFSLTWGTLVLDLHSYDARFKAPSTDPLANELQGGPNQYVLDANTDWFEVTINGLTASSTSTVLKFTGQNNNSATLVDDVTVEETPEPSTVVLLGAGAALMGLRRRRRVNS